MNSNASVYWDSCNSDFHYKFERKKQKLEFTRHVINKFSTFPSSEKRPIRGPIIIAATNAAIPPVPWTTPEPVHICV